MRFRPARLLPVVCAATLAVPAPAVPGAPRPRLGPSDRYLHLLDSYLVGPRADAIAALGKWKPGELKRELDAIGALARSAETCRRQAEIRALPADSSCEVLVSSFRALPLRAAVLLHSQRDVVDRPFEIEGESISPSCGTQLHDAAAGSLVEWLLLQQPQARDFARRFYLAMTLRTHHDLCVADARTWANAGLVRFPKDAELLLALGTAEEVIELRLTPAPLVPLTRDQRGGASVREHRELLERARLALEQALAAQPRLHEARLRLGNVLWRLGQNGARAALQEVLAQNDDPWILQLGHLFLGRHYESAGQLREATLEYRAALAEEPHSETAAVALAYALALSGDRAEARAVTVQALADARRRPVDAYRKYLAGRYARAEALWQDLRNEMRP